MPILSRSLWLPVLLGVAGAAWAADKPSCRYRLMAELPVTYVGESLELTVAGTIEGKPASMLADTGADRSFLTRAGAAKTGRPLRVSEMSVEGIGGITSVYWVRLDDLSVGDTHSGDISLPVIGEISGSSPHDAIVGAEFLLQTDLEIALTDKQIRFFKPNGCKNSFLGYWNPDASEIPFVRTENRDRRPHFVVELNGKKMEAIIDTGATRSAIDVRAARRAGIRTDSAAAAKTRSAAGIGARMAARWRAVFDTFSIGNETIQHAEIDIVEGLSGTGGEIDMLLGQDFLRAHRVLFAMEQGQLYLSYLGGDVFARRRSAIEPWLLREAEAGNADAQFALYKIYLAGSDPEQDGATAAAWLAKAAAQGHQAASRAMSEAGAKPRAVPAN